LGTPQTFAFKLDTMGIVNNAIEDRIGERRIADNVVQAIKRDLAGDEERAFVVSIIDDLEEIAALLVIERFRSKIVNY
jgi:hypothetical protein